jgi:hypothetical protein
MVVMLSPPTDTTSELPPDETGQDGAVTETGETAEDVAERLRRRYPPNRVPRPVLLAVLAVAVAGAVAWVIWAATAFSTPPVAARVAAYTVTSNTSIDVVLTVDRRNPAQSATCRVVAQSPDFQPVAEQRVAIAPSQARVVDVSITLTTLRRATTATVSGCAID